MACPPVAANNNYARFPPTGLVPTVIAFTGGVFYSPTLLAFTPPTLSWVILTTLALSISITACFKKQRLAFILAIPLFFFLGIIRAAPFTEPPNTPQHIYNKIQTRKEVAITAILTAMPALSGNRSRITMAAEQLIHPDGTTTTTDGLILLTINGRIPNNIEPGDRLIARASLKRPRGFLTPGVFDYSKYLAEKNIWITGWVRSPILLHKLYQPAKTPLSEQLHYLPERLRHRAGIFFEHNLDHQTSALYRALLLGDRSAVDPTIIDNFTRTGCIHLLAISGTHMGILAILTTLISIWLLKRSSRLTLRFPIWKIGALVTMPVIFSYALLAGFQTPAIRALTMTTVFLLAILIDRQWSIPVNIAIAALLLLTWNPLLIHSVSFQLSFTAVIAIYLLYPKITNLLNHREGQNRSIIHKLRHWLLAGLGVSIAATIGVLPLLLLHFNLLSNISPISTLLTEPFLCLWALTLGLFACIALPFSSWIAINLLQLGAQGLHAALFINSFLATLPFASFRWPCPTQQKSPYTTPP